MAAGGVVFLVAVLVLPLVWLVLEALVDCVWEATRQLASCEAVSGSALHSRNGKWQIPCSPSSPIFVVEHGTYPLPAT